MWLKWFIFWLIKVNYGQTRYFIDRILVAVPSWLYQFMDVPLPLDRCVAFGRQQVNVFSSEIMYAMYTCNDNGNMVTRQIYSDENCQNPTGNSIYFIKNYTTTSPGLHDFECNGFDNYVTIHHVTTGFIGINRYCETNYIVTAVVGVCFKPTRINFDTWGPLNFEPYSYFQCSNALGGIMYISI